eukprot:4610737-Pleurochrysis_carterae.AAC.2
MFPVAHGLTACKASELGDVSLTPTVATVPKGVRDGRFVVLEDDCPFVSLSRTQVKGIKSEQRQVEEEVSSKTQMVENQARAHLRSHGRRFYLHFELRTVAPPSPAALRFFSLTGGTCSERCHSGASPRLCANAKRRQFG